jgi:hydroxyethylthiazole kinase
MKDKMEQKIWENIQKVRTLSPLVHNITNYVVMNSSANALLAAGASPVMAHAEEEVRDMVRISDSLVLNIGTLSKKWIDSMKIALKEANRLGKPVVFDPVGAGATNYRTETVKDLLNTGTISVMRGNASEIMALMSAGFHTKGVESTESAGNAVESAKLLQQKYKCIICISGKIDYILSQDEIAEIHNGHEMMSRITGMGCSATALIGAFAGITNDYFEAAISGMALMGVAGELAVRESSGPGSLQIHFYDKLNNLTSKDFFETIKIQIDRNV